MRWSDNLFDLLEWADGVAVWNSTVGFEATLLGKSVELLEPGAFYAPLLEWNPPLLNEYLGWLVTEYLHWTTEDPW